MRHRRWLAGAALLCNAVAAQAAHFEYRVDLHGLYSEGGTEGCFPPDFNQPACPRDGTLTALLTFDTPVDADGAFLIAGDSGDVTNFRVDLGGLSNEPLYGGINVNQGVPNGTVQPLDQSESFTFDWGSRTAWYSYDYGYHAPNGNFSGTLSAVSVSEPGSLSLLLGALATVAWVRRLRRPADRRA